MIVSITPSDIKGIIRAPASKSSMQRACAAALLLNGKTVIKNPGHSNDDLAAIGIIQKLGATVQTANGEMIVVSNGFVEGSRVSSARQPDRLGDSDRDAGENINCGESGLGIRMFAPIIALSERKTIINGKGSLLNRPMNFFDAVLPLLEVKYKSKNGKLPIIIQGPLVPKNIEVDGSVSSQFLTGLLLAYAAADAKNVSIKVKNLKSQPYIDLTLKVMKDFGLKMPVNRNYEEFYFESSTVNHQPSAVNYTVEGDWSGGAFLLVAGAVAGEVEVQGLYNTSTQADKKIVDALLDAGAEVKVYDDKVFVKKDKLNAFTFDATDCPDMFPPLVALSAHCTGISRIRGVKRLKHKESDRGVTLKEEFDKLSTRIDLTGDEMMIYGNGGVFVKNHKLNSHHDHRIAMACAVACVGADFDVEIRNAEAINKSYPDFWSDLINLNAIVKL